VLYCIISYTPKPTASNTTTTVATSRMSHLTLLVRLQHLLHWQLMSMLLRQQRVGQPRALTRSRWALWQWQTKLCAGPYGARDAERRMQDNGVVVLVMQFITQCLSLHSTIESASDVHQYSPPSSSFLITCHPDHLAKQVTRLFSLSTHTTQCVDTDAWL
jgi:hypothetical protein